MVRGREPRSHLVEKRVQGLGLPRQLVIVGQIPKEEGFVSVFSNNTEDAKVSTVTGSQKRKRLFNIISHEREKYT